MINKIDEFKKYIKDKKVAILGIGVSHTPLIKYLGDIGVKITAFDKADKEKIHSILQQFDGMDIEFSLGEDYLKKLNDFDVIFRTPGMRYDLPEIEAEIKRGAKLTSEMEVFFELCPAQIFAITGSDGKTTTTTLIYNLLKEAGYQCWLGGNIGYPLLSKVEEIKESDKVILELSSFQLHTMKNSPSVAVVTNVTPNHLDIHKSMEEYVEAKENIYLFQTATDKLVLNYDNGITRSFQEKAKGAVEFFSRVDEVENGAFLQNEKIVYKKNGKVTEIMDCKDIILPGTHNVENYLAAITAVFDYVDLETIKKMAITFKGVAHRIELVREKDGVKFYNDSIASSPTRTIAGLNSFQQKVILIAGGYDKKIPYNEIGKVILEKVKHLILIGQTASKIEDAVLSETKLQNIENDLVITKYCTLEEAVSKASEVAKKGDVVILSPASASFDMFRNFEERGNKFKEIVQNL